MLYTMCHTYTHFPGRQKKRITISWQHRLAHAIVLLSHNLRLCNLQDIVSPWVCIHTFNIFTADVRVSHVTGGKYRLLLARILLSAVSGENGRRDEGLRVSPRIITITYEEIPYADLCPCGKYTLVLSLCFSGLFFFFSSTVSWDILWNLSNYFLYHMELYVLSTVPQNSFFFLLYIIDDFNKFADFGCNVIFLCSWVREEVCMKYKYKI